MNQQQLPQQATQPQQSQQPQQPQQPTQQTQQQQQQLGLQKRLCIKRELDEQDSLENSWREQYEKIEPLMNNTPENELLMVLIERVGETPERHADVTVALLYGILVHGHNSYFKQLTLITKDGLVFFCTQLKKLINDRFQKLCDLPRQQTLWLLSELISSNHHDSEAIAALLMRHIYGGNITPKNIALATSLLTIISSNKSWLYTKPMFIPTALYTYLRLLQDHLKPQFKELRESETSFCLDLIKNKFAESITIGRDFVRMIMYLAPKVPEFEQLWKDLNSKPSQFQSNFTDISSIMRVPSPKHHLQFRLSPEMETQVLFILKEVKFGNQKRYQQWFVTKHLPNIESESLIPDLIRYICCCYHPSNQVLCSDIVPRWAIIGWLLKHCKEQWRSQAKLALFYDWLFYDPKHDSIMNIEPAMLLMACSIKKYSDMTVDLVEYIVHYLLESHDLQRKDQIKNGINTAFTQTLEKGVVPSLAPMFSIECLGPQLFEKVKVYYLHFISNSPIQQSQILPPQQPIHKLSHSQQGNPQQQKNPASPQFLSQQPHKSPLNTSSSSIQQQQSPSMHSQQVPHQSPSLHSQPMNHQQPQQQQPHPSPLQQSQRIPQQQPQQPQQKEQSQQQKEQQKDSTPQQMSQSQTQNQQQIKEDPMKVDHTDEPKEQKEPSLPNSAPPSSKPSPALRGSTTTTPVNSTPTLSSQPLQPQQSESVVAPNPSQKRDREQRDKEDSESQAQQPPQVPLVKEEIPPVVSKKNENTSSVSNTPQQTPPILSNTPKSSTQSQTQLVPPPVLQLQPQNDQNHTTVINTSQPQATSSTTSSLPASATTQAPTPASAPTPAVTNEQENTSSSNTPTSVPAPVPSTQTISAPSVPAASTTIVSAPVNSTASATATATVTAPTTTANNNEDQVMTDVNNNHILPETNNINNEHIIIDEECKVEVPNLLLTFENTKSDFQPINLTTTLKSILNNYQTHITKTKEPTEELTTTLSSYLCNTLKPQFENISPLSLFTTFQIIHHIFKAAFPTPSTSNEPILNLLREIYKLEPTISFHLVVWSIIISPGGLSQSNNSNYYVYPDIDIALNSATAYDDKDSVNSLAFEDEERLKIERLIESISDCNSPTKSILNPYLKFINHINSNQSNQNNSNSNNNNGNQQQNNLIIDHILSDCKRMQHINIFFYILPMLYRYLSGYTTGNTDLLMMIIDNIDPKQQYRLCNKLSMGEFRLFGNSPLTLINHSFQLESFEQSYVWQLFVAEDNYHHSLMTKIFPGIISKLDPFTHSEALLYLSTGLKDTEVNLKTVSDLLMMSSNFHPFALTVFSYWQQKQTKLFTSTIYDLIVSNINDRKYIERILYFYNLYFKKFFNNSSSAMDDKLMSGNVNNSGTSSGMNSSSSNIGGSNKEMQDGLHNNDLNDRIVRIFKTNNTYQHKFTNLYQYLFSANQQQQPPTPTISPQSSSNNLNNLKRLKK